MAARHQGLGRGFGEFFQRTDLETDESGTAQDAPAEAKGDVSRETSTSQRQDRYLEHDADVSRETSSPTVVDDRSRTPVKTARDPQDAPQGYDDSPTDSDQGDSTLPSTAGLSQGQTDEGASNSIENSNSPENPNSPENQTTTSLVDGSRLQILPVSRVHPNPRQPRRVFDEEALLELSESIAEVGLLQPIVVTPDADETFEIVMGERRWRASRLAGLTTVPAIVRATEAQDMLRDALLENLHRSQLNPLEEAAAYQQMLEDFGCTQEELSQRIKRSRSRIANTLRLMKLPRVVQRCLLDGTLTAGHARALLGLEERAEQERIANKIVDEGLSVRATEALVQKVDSDKTEVKPHTRRKPGSDEEAIRIASRLADVYDTDVTVKRTKTRGSGRIVLAFEDEDDLNRIMGILERDATMASE